MKVKELATELGVDTKELLGKLKALGLSVKTAASVVDDTAAELMREEYAAPASPVQPAEETKPVPKKKPKAAVAEKPKAVVAEKPKPVPAEKAKAVADEAAAVPEAVVGSESEKVIVVRGSITVKELAKEFGMMPNKLIAELMKMKILASVTERLDLKVVKDIAEKHGFTVEHEKKVLEHSQILQKKTDEEAETEDRPEDLVPRPPVVTFLGHVDHGKTSLLDRIKNSSVAKGESGGITQHIGAYSVEVSGRKITFLDTPGHEAFNAMRARGANLTDIAVVVIAADDGIMPQTKEAIKFAKQAEVTIVFAINKTDLPGADVNRVKQQLQIEGLTTEDWGGDYISCEVSAVTGAGIDHLLDMIILQADVLELSANPNRRASGYVIESQLEAGQGPTANVLVCNGTLKVGDFVLCGSNCGKIRALINDHGVNLKSVGPGYAVKCLGLSGVAEAGAEFKVYANEKTGRDIAEQARLGRKTAQLTTSKDASVEDLFKRIEKDLGLELKVLVKADTQGSVEAISQSLRKIQSTKVSLNIILSGTGNVNVTDVSLAGSSNGLIVGFHVGMEPGVKAACKHARVSICIHEVIYELIDHVKSVMTDLLPPLIEEHLRGQADVKQVFPIGKKDLIAGCMVTSGYITPKLKARVLRGSDIIHQGPIKSLRHFQDEVSQVKESQECGILLANFVDIVVGDKMDFIELEEKKQTL